MKRLLTLEALKNLRYRPFKILTGLYFLTLIVLLFVGIVDFKIFGSIDINLKEQGIYNFPAIWNFTTYIAGWFQIFLGLIIVFSVSQEFTHRMYKQNLIDGLSRKEFILSKVLTITVLSLLSTLVIFITTLILGLVYAKDTSASLVFAEIGLVPIYALKLFGYFCFLLFLTILLRKSIFALMALFFWWVAEGILSLVTNLTMIRTENEAAIHSSSDIGHNTLGLSSFLPLNATDLLIPNPLPRLELAATMLGPYKFEYPWVSILVVIAWSVIFIWGSYAILKGRDI